MTDTADPRRERLSDDQRREERFADARIALVRFSNEECLGTIENVSMNGARVALFTETFPEEGEILVEGSYEDGWVAFRGRVRYATTHGGGWTVGVECEDDCRRKNFVATRYRT